MIEIRCTRENVRQALLEHFPKPSPGHLMAISHVIEALSYPRPTTGVFAQGYRSIPLGVEVQIVPDEPDVDREHLAKLAAEGDGIAARMLELDSLSTSQASIPNTPEEEAAWREKERQATVAGQEEHAARRHAPVGYYARTVDERLPTEQSAEADAMRRKLLEVATLTPADYAAWDKANEDIRTLGEQIGVDNANAGEVGTFTDGPEERYSLGGKVDAQGDLAIIDRFKPPMKQCIGWAKSEHAQLIVDALNAYEASQ